MRAGRGWRRLTVPLVVVATGVSMAATAAPVTATPSTTMPSTTTHAVPVRQLSNRVEKLIRAVEGSSLPCATQNSVLRLLRNLDDALVSGRRSAAQALALAWDQHAWNLQSARVLSPELGSTLQNGLAAMPDQIGVGWSVKPGPARHWKPLPSCGNSGPEADSGTPSAGVAASSYTPYAASNISSDIEIFVTTLFNYIPIVGQALSGLTQLLWPQGPDATTNSLQQMVKQAAYDSVSTELTGIGESLMGNPANPEAGAWNSEVAAWHAYCDTHGGDRSTLCVAQARDTLWGAWNSLNRDVFLHDRPAFQQNTSEVSNLDLLPLYAQYENLYMSFLRDGILMHWYWDDRTDMNPYWGNLDQNVPAKSMAGELNPNNLSYGVGYTDSVYHAGLDQQPAATSDWRTRNEYIRNMTLGVLDARDTWKFEDPAAYPDPIPGGVKLTRMIWTYPTGHMQSQPVVPTNVGGPLKELTLWTKPVEDGGTYVFRNISSSQVTSPPLLGPAQSGPVTGITSQPVNVARYYDLAALGPISEVKTQSYQSGCIGKQQNIPSWVGLYYAKGGHSDNGSYLSYDDTNDLAYDGEVLAAVRVVGSYDVGSCGDHVGDSILFGFRYADSYLPSGTVIGTASGKCIDVPSLTQRTQAVIRTCGVPPVQTQVWAYDQGLEQISMTTADGAKHCLDAAGGATTAGTPVVLNACDDGAQTYGQDGTAVRSSQRWQVTAVGAVTAEIVNVKSGLALTVTGSQTADDSGLSLQAYAGSASQQWQAHAALTGEIHGVGSGRCVDVPNLSTTPGTQVQLFDCYGNGAQQWTYNPTNKELLYAHAPSLCLTARGGGTVAGTAVEVNTCRDAPEQHWTLHGNGSTISNDKSGLVLGVPGGSTADHALLDLEAAAGTGAQGQLWSRTSTQGGEVHSIAAGRCLDVASLTDGTPVAIQNCVSPPSQTQTWVYHPIAQTFTVSSGGTVKCLDAPTSGAATNVAVVVGDCVPNSPSQRWSRNYGRSTIENVASGLLLDLAGGATAAGTAVWLTPQPDAGPTATQKWAWSLT